MKGDLFTVCYPYGELTIYLEAFFPTAQKKALRLFCIIRDNSLEDEAQELLGYLHKRAVILSLESARAAERCQKNAELLSKITGITLKGDGVLALLSGN